MKDIVVLVLVLVLVLVVVKAEGSKGSGDGSVSCQLSVVGSGWGGIYFAWRIAIDQPRLDPASICVFEAHKTRFGGRAYTFQDEQIEGLTLDLGAYRFSSNHKHVIGLTKKFGFNSTCYDLSLPVCPYYVVADPFENNLGFLSVIQAMINELRAAGTRFELGFELTGVYPIENSENLLLKFANGQQVETSNVVLNIPNQAVNRLDPKSVLFTEGSQEFKAVLNDTTELLALKYYLYYDDAWWVNLLKLTDGSFTSSDSTLPPLLGRYHDGPIFCDDRTCRGAILVFYGFGDQITYYPQFRFSLQEIRTEFSATYYPDVMLEVHKSLVAFHQEKLLAIGVDPASLPLPKKGYMSIWEGNDYLYIQPGEETLNMDLEEAQKIIEKPLAGRNIFMTNQAWTKGYFADPVLVLTERILQNQFKLSPPSWID